MRIGLISQSRRLRSLRLAASFGGRAGMALGAGVLVWGIVSSRRELSRLEDAGAFAPSVIEYARQQMDRHQALIEPTNALARSVRDLRSLDATRVDWEAVMAEVSRATPEGLVITAITSELRGGVMRVRIEGHVRDGVHVEMIDRFAAAMRGSALVREVEVRKAASETSLLATTFVLEGVARTMVTRVAEKGS
ncbi:MAG: hypothetical protein AB7Q00_09510 [Phycisphaerales bacterium]|nr:MAG: hypothetical protein IPK69_02095 [Phycisphaerales bacterium]